MKRARAVIRDRIPRTVKEGLRDANAPADPRTRPYANGDIDCQAMHKRIDPCICGIQAWRFPGTCTGCRWNKEKGEHHETT